MSPPLDAAAAGIAGLQASAWEVKPSLPRILDAIRRHMGMDVAFISEIAGGRRYFRHIDVGDSGFPVVPGDSHPAEESYCLRVVDGRLPELIPNACLNTEALTLAATLALPVGAHLSVPIRLADGRVYGTFCCFSFSPNATLTGRDLSVMRVLADMVGDQIQQDLEEQEAKRLVDERIDAALGSSGLRMVFQPIVQVETGRVVAFEALARFATEPYRSPDVWFAEAALAGRAAELEIMAIRLALASLVQLPPSIYLTVNASPETIVTGALADALRGQPLDRIVVEVTEHQAIERYEDIMEAVAPLKASGLRIAIDDAGAGYASFRHILNLHPEIVKLDISITRSIHSDRSRRALAAALCGFASETGCQIVAEGVETNLEFQVIKALGISKVQGYHLGRPVPLKDALALL
ncbi:EAL domain-containing protein [Roseateles sp.]|uniref:sensor domain-containing phosphodiesterase n=1 Tax=Roseateles sp. TaxID=1971397 RepID=UPI0025E88CFC|nr:EAL domain-containing protein [Roseateles sp.]MBV8034133.1 EAL domain-containing protein [Roseateles sp.]